MTRGLVLVLSDDLIFTSRIAATVRSVGGQIRDCRDWPTLVQSAEALQPACVIIDLQNPGLNLAELVGRLLRVGEGTRPAAGGVWLACANGGAEASASTGRGRGHAA
jgi:FixJ family two-component response regulator